MTSSSPESADNSPSPGGEGRGEGGRILFQHGLESTCPNKIPRTIIPHIIGDESAAVTAAQQLRDQGVYLPAIRYPTVARGQARLRITLTADHTPEDVEQLLAALTSLRRVTEGGTGFQPVERAQLREHST